MVWEVHFLKVIGKAGLMGLHTWLFLSVPLSLEWRTVMAMSPLEKEACLSGDPGRGMLPRDSSSLPGVGKKSHEGTCFTSPLEAGEEQPLFSCSSITRRN